MKCRHEDRDVRQTHIARPGVVCIDQEERIRLLEPVWRRENPLTVDIPDQVVRLTSQTIQRALTVRRRRPTTRLIPRRRQADQHSQDKERPPRVDLMPSLQPDIEDSAWLAPNEAISSHVRIVRNEAIARVKVLSLATRDFPGIMSGSPTGSGVASWTRRQDKSCRATRNLESASCVLRDRRS
jgi:hypothetical protein